MTKNVTGGRRLSAGRPRQVIEFKTQERVEVDIKAFGEYHHFTGAAIVTPNGTRAMRIATPDGEASITISAVCPSQSRKSPARFDAIIGELSTMVSLWNPRPNRTRSATYMVGAQSWARLLRLVVARDGRYERKGDSAIAEFSRS